MKEIKITQLIQSKTNPRKHFDQKALKDLAESINKQGIISPILVRPATGGKFEIVAGERRYRAAKIAKLKTMPAIERTLTDEEVLEIQVVENLQREDVHPLEEAEGYEQLIKKYGYKTADEIAAKIGKSRSYVYGRMKLCALIPACRKMFYTGALNASTALLIARIPQHLQEPAAKDITGESARAWQKDILSYREAKNLIENNYMLRLADVIFDKNDPELVGNAGSCEKCKKRTGNEPDLFEDIKSTDVCTDPQCFKLKKERWIANILIKAAEQGKVVLDREENKKVFPHDTVYPCAGYSALDVTCWEDSKNRKYKQLLKGVACDSVFGVDGKGKLRELMKDKELEKAIKQAGIKTSRRSSADPDRKKIILKQKAALKIADAVMEKVREDKEQSWWRLLARGIVDRAHHETHLLICKRLGSEYKKSEGPQKTIERLLKQTPDDQLPAFCFQFFAPGGYSHWSNSYDGILPAAAKHYGIDIRKIERSLTKGSNGKKKKSKNKKKAKK